VGKVKIDAKTFQEPLEALPKIAVMLRAGVEPAHLAGIRDVSVRVLR
jgi:hypothetical protein